MKRTTAFLIVLLWVLNCFTAKAQDTAWFHLLDFTKSVKLYQSVLHNISTEKQPVVVGKQTYSKGVGIPEGLITVDLKGAATAFRGKVAMDDHVPKGFVRFVFYADKKEVFNSGLLGKGMAPVLFDIPLTGAQRLSLVVENDGDGIHTAHADWLNAYLLYKKLAPQVLPSPVQQPYILTPKASPLPRIHSPMIYGSRPGHPFLFKIAASGQRPMWYSARGLPEGLRLDSLTGIITGSLTAMGETIVKLGARNSLGETVRELKIVGGSKISLTPAMGWNSWNCFADAVSADKIKEAANAMLQSGLADYGYNYINIDDCWEVKQTAGNRLLMKQSRDRNGMIKTNSKFPDMKNLTGYLHRLGLKAGLYSSPGEVTCGGYMGSYKFEKQDAKQWANWGFDYVKYDWCSYYKVFDTTDQSVAEIRKPYQIMGDALKQQDRDILFSLCQYGMGNVGEWGQEAGGNSWRTSRDVHDTWTSMAGIGFNQAGREKYAGPGHWNDVDMLVVGMVGWGPKLRPTRLTPDEQYSHISLWSLLASPLLIGCDMNRLDSFTLNLLTNHEVIAINQDPLGIQAARVSQDGKAEVWAKRMYDGSLAVGLFNRSIFDEEVTATWKALGIEGAYIVRDAWRQKDLGIYKNSFKDAIASHGVRLLLLKPVK